MIESTFPKYLKLLQLTDYEITRNSDNQFYSIFIKEKELIFNYVDQLVNHLNVVREQLRQKLTDYDQLIKDENLTIDDITPILEIDCKILVNSIRFYRQEILKYECILIRSMKSISILSKNVISSDKYSEQVSSSIV